ncbi:MAG TPA: hypothetical protein GXX75_11250 [Clostridiales bacterium]|nr:hypothetical protein [Clostridiales bacterium]
MEAGEKVKEMAEQGIAVITQNEDGTKTVTYKGTRRDAYITLGDVQKSAMNLLNVILKSSTCKYVYNEETGYEPVAVKPYSSLFDNLKEYVRCESIDLFL